MSNNQPYDNNPLNRLTPEMMDGFAKGTLSPDLMKKVEAFLEENPFEAAAVEGLRQQPVDLSAEMSELEGRLSARVTPKSGTWFRYYWAAAISILLISALVLYKLVPSEPDSPAIAVKQETVTPAEIEPVTPTPKVQDESTPTEQHSPDSENNGKLQNQVNQSVDQPVVNEGKNVAPENKPAVPEPIRAEAPEAETELVEPFPSDIQETIREKPLALNNRAASKRSAEISAADHDQGQKLELPVAGYPEGWEDYLSENLRYPKEALDAGIRGSVKIIFEVNTDGRPEQFNVIEKLGYGCDQEALRVLQNGPSWKPATINGAPVVSMAEIAIKFPLP